MGERPGHAFLVGSGSERPDYAVDNYHAVRVCPGCSAGLFRIGGRGFRLGIESLRSYGVCRGAAIRPVYVIFVAALLAGVPARR